MRTLTLAVVSSLLASGGDLGVPPRAHPSDYPVHQTAKTAELAAVVIPARQIEKMFSSEIARQYVVVEVAVYPQDRFNVDWFDFALKAGDSVSHVEKPRDVATPWPEKTSSVDRPVAVITETGVGHSSGSDPGSVNGRRTGWSTYESVTVTNDPRASAPPPPPKSGPDPQIVEQRVREKMLPQGSTGTAIAGYLFFPRYEKKHTNGTMELQWSSDDSSAVLRLK